MSQLGRPTTFPRDAGSGSRNKSEKICLILNPRAGAGRAGARLDELKLAVDRAFEQWEVQTTQGPGHAVELARKAADAGFSLVAAVGGDGTAHEVVNGLMEGDFPRNPRATFSLIPFGTGSDLQKTLRIPKSLPEALWMAATGITLPTDVGRVTLDTEAGPKSEYFINVAGFGTNGEVVRRANQMDKSWGGQVTFFRATVGAAFAYTPQQIEITYEGPDGPGTWTGALTSCFVANAAYCGGGMWVGKGGTMQDGWFDVILLEPSPFVLQLAEVRRLYDGTVLKMRGAHGFRARSLKARCLGADPVYIDLDGEAPGRLPVQFELLPSVLPVRGGWVHSPVTAGR